MSREQCHRHKWAILAQLLRKIHIELRKSRIYVALIAPAALAVVASVACVAAKKKMRQIA